MINNAMSEAVADLGAYIEQSSGDVAKRFTMSLTPI
jgi:hypothetical protein